MKQSMSKRLLCGLLTVLLLLGSSSTVFAANTATAAGTDKPTTSLDDLKELFETISYKEYIASFENVESNPEKFVVNLGEAYIDPAKAEEKTDEADKEEIADQPEAEVETPADDAAAENTEATENEGVQTADEPVEKPDESVVNTPDAQPGDAPDANVGDTPAVDAPVADEPAVDTPAEDTDAKADEEVKEEEKEEEPTGRFEPTKETCVLDAEEVKALLGRDKTAVYLSGEGLAEFKINVPKSGFYTFKIEYHTVGDMFGEENAGGKEVAIERMLRVDGAIPFSEARYLTLPRMYVDVLLEDGNFDTDYVGNDIRPAKKQVFGWNTYTFMDSTGFEVDPLLIYLTEGEHVIGFSAVREPVVFADMTFEPARTLPKYADVEKEYKKNGYKDVSDKAAMRIEAEKPDYTSDQTIYPLNDRSSSITYPQDPSKTRLNTIGSDKWENVGQWIQYNVTFEESGLYELAMRFKQSELEGMYVSRSIYINGEIPFEEAKNVEFLYSDSWQHSVVGMKDGNGKVKPFKFYFEAGKTYEIRFEVVLGTMSGVLERANTCLTKMNEAYIKILKITGSSPDQDRDYDFARTVPDAIDALKYAAKELDAIGKELEKMTGQTGSHVATLNKVVVLLDRMVSDEDEIAKNLINLKTYIGTLGTWLLDSRTQPLEIDYLTFQKAGTKLPEANSNFFESLWFEIQAFFMSFFTDYSSMGSKEKVDPNNKVEVWTTIGREKSKILRQLVDSGFMSTNPGFGVEIKLVSGGILQSTLAGIGPDVAFLASADCVNYAIRDAVLPLNDMEGFDEAVKHFPDSAMNTLRLVNNEGVEETYGLPNTVTFLMMFYRTDILYDLGVEAPKTWDDLKRIIPVLQNAKMTIGFPSKTAGTKLFLYQKGGEMYADGGKRINLDSNIALDAFTELTDLFQEYRFPLTYEAANRFRTGEMPILIQDYISLYNQLTVFAPEIDGMWEFAPLPGFEYVDENGETKINNSAVVTVEAVCLMRGATENKEQAWKFLQWFTEAETQKNYSNELVAVVGQSSKNATGNLDALVELPWTQREYENISYQLEHSAGITEYPGGYIITRYIDFAFMDVYNDGVNASDAMLDYIVSINKEISRKREEFGFEAYDIGELSTNQFVESKD